MFCYGVVVYLLRLFQSQIYLFLGYGNLGAGGSYGTGDLGGGESDSVFGSCLSIIFSGTSTNVKPTVYGSCSVSYKM